MGSIHSMGRFIFLLNDDGSLLEINDTSYNVVYSAFTCLAFNQVFEAACRLLSNEELSELEAEITDKDLVVIIKGILATR